MDRKENITTIFNGENCLKKKKGTLESHLKEKCHLNKIILHRKSKSTLQNHIEGSP